MFYGVGRGTTTRVTLVPLTAIGTTLITVTTTTVFGWFVSWISSVIINIARYQIYRPVTWVASTFGQCQEDDTVRILCWVAIYSFLAKAVVTGRG